MLSGVSMGKREMEKSMVDIIDIVEYPWCSK